MLDGRILSDERIEKMRLADTLQFASGSLRGSPTRTLLMMLAMSIGVAAVVVLTRWARARAAMSSISSHRWAPTS